MSDKNEYRKLLDEVEQHLNDATNSAIRDRITLRDAVCAFFFSERAKGASLDDVLQSVEAVLKRAEARSGRVNGYAELARQLIDWCTQMPEPGQSATPVGLV